MQMQRTGLRSNVLQVTVFEKKLQQQQLVTGRAHTLLPHTQITRVHATPFLSRITCLNSSWSGSTGKFCTLLDGDLMAFLFQLGAGRA